MQYTPRRVRAQIVFCFQSDFVPAHRFASLFAKALLMDIQKDVSADKSLIDIINDIDQIGKIANTTGCVYLTLCFFCAQQSSTMLV
jgi:hypothetical protein